MSSYYHQRKSPRLQGYDYSQLGAYFVTICTYQRFHLFGAIEHEKMLPSIAGKIAATCWGEIGNHYPDVELDVFVVMPNHVHGIVVLNGSSHFKTTLGRVINGYKGAVTARIREHDADLIVWQSRYHDHIIRNEPDLNRIRDYVETNPLRWETDVFYGEG